MIPQVKELLKKPQYKQKSPEWFSQRENIITASSAATLLKKTEGICKNYVKQFHLQNLFEYDNKACNPYSSKISYIKAKAGLEPSTFTGNDATFWGQKYEPIATNVYTLIKNTSVIEFGLLIHDTLNWLGASPDGITPDGVMLEIKCPSRRKITGTPPLYYWIQVQLQLEVCDLESCDFLECEFIEYLTYKEFIDDTIDNYMIYYKGVIIERLDPSLSFEEKYIYPDSSTINNLTSTLELMEEYSDCKVIFWKLVNYNIINIPREREWFKIAKNDLHSEFKFIQEVKTNPELVGLPALAVSASTPTASGS